MEYTTEEWAIAAQRGYIREDEWAKYRLQLKKSLREKGIVFNKKALTTELEALLR